jgi:uncharacterized membrane protein
MPLANLTNMTDAERANRCVVQPCKEKMTTHAEKLALDRRAL